MEERAREHLFRLYEMLLRMRRMEECVHKQYADNAIKGPVHIAIGMEAVAAGFGLAMKEGDYTLCSYRGHTHALARGVTIESILAEMLGRSSGLIRGKGGSMHLASFGRGLLGSNAIVGAQLLTAVGAAWSAQVRESDSVTVCFFGDGTTNIGAFHEALNMAAIWALPLVFVCENNLYMEYTRTADVTAVARPAADRASAYGLGCEVIDGNDVTATYDCGVEALAQCRNGAGPVLVEALTYRTFGHSSADPGNYRPVEEVNAWAARDPVMLAASRLVAAGVPNSRLEILNVEIQTEIEGALDRARSAPIPGEDELSSCMWADGGSEWRQ